VSKKPNNQKSLSVFQQTWWVWAVYALSVVVLIILVSVPRSWSTISRIQGTFNYGNITILRPWVQKSIFWSGLFCFIMLWITIFSILCRKHISLRVFNVILILLFLISPVYCSISYPQIWGIYDQAVGPDDNSYYYMAWSFMMGGESALCRLESRTLFKERFKVLQTKAKDSGVGQKIIRPAGFIRDNHLRLYISESGYIVAMLENKCKLAYDFNSKRSFGEENINEISPFLLIDSNTPMNQNDVRDLISRMKELRQVVDDGYNPSSYNISKSIFEKSLEHPNKKVAKLTQQLLDILGEEKVEEPDRLEKIQLLPIGPGIMSPKGKPRPRGQGFLDFSRRSE